MSEHQNPQDLYHNPTHHQQSPTYHPQSINKQQDQHITSINHLRTILKTLKIDNPPKTPINANNQRISYLELELKAEEQRIAQLLSMVEQEQQRSNRMLKEQQQRHRKQIQKYVEVITQKQYKVESLNRIINSQNANVSRLKADIQSLTEKQHLYEKTLAKNIEALKMSIRELNTALEQNEIDKLILEQKVGKIENRIQGTYCELYKTQENRKSLQQKYHKLKVKNIELKEQNMELKFQIEEIKIRREEEQKYRNHPYINRNNSKTYLDGPGVRSQLSQIHQLSTTISDLFNNSKQFYTRISETEKLTRIIDEYKMLNTHLEQQLNEKNRRIDELEIKLDGQHLEQILKERKPSIYEDLMHKKALIAQFESKIEYLVNYINNKQFSEPPSLHSTKSAISDQSSNLKSVGVGSWPVNQHIQSENKKNVVNLQEEVKCNKLKIKNLQTKLQQQKYEKSRLQRLYKIYKTELADMIGIYESNRGKKMGKGTKIKKKSRCQVCLLEYNPKKHISCSDCSRKMHEECMENHQCKKDPESMSVCSSDLEF